MNQTLPSISVVIPTLNAGAFLESCLKSIVMQVYPKNKIEIIIADGGSTDSTLQIATKYKAKIISNPLKTSESGKFVGVKKSKNQLIAFIDSDNILTTKYWLKKIVYPFRDKEILAAEPIRFAYRRKDPFLTRYFATLGLNDPVSLFIGNYAHQNILTDRWTDLQFPVIDKNKYLEVTFNRLATPTVGANGFVIRKNILTLMGSKDYLFDVDLIPKLVQKFGKIKIAKVKVSIVHTYVEDSPRKFFKKQLRRINDMYYHRSRETRYIDMENQYFWKIIWFQLMCLLVVPILYQTIRGYLKTRDNAWFFHPVACYSTWFIYAYGWVKGRVNPSESSRDNWKQ